MPHSHSFRAHGKLLLFGEYFVLDGCKALAWPTRFGQSLEVSKDDVLVKGLYWKSINYKGEIWFEAYFDEELNLLHGLGDEIAVRLQKFLMHARALNPAFLKDGFYHEAIITADYPSEWGLGSSSTLIYLIAQWAEVDAMELFFRSFTGSGYDIACAGASGPILYQLEKEKQAIWKEIALSKEDLQGVYFVYLGKKQDSREGIAHYQKHKSEAKETVTQLDTLIEDFLKNRDRKHLLSSILKSESIIGSTLNLPLVKDQFFADFPGEIKSLGAWGGDFVMALAGETSFGTAAYFQEKGYEVIFPAKDLLL